MHVECIYPIKLSIPDLAFPRRIRLIPVFAPICAAQRVPRVTHAFFLSF